MKKQTKKAQKTAAITLRANGSSLTLAAVLKADGTAVTTVTTRDAEKHSARGMTESHTTMEAAKAHLASLAEKAEKLGWRRGLRAVSLRPDAFSKLPMAPASANSPRG
jgi:hypothetical protein